MTTRAILAAAVAALAFGPATHAAPTKAAPAKPIAPAAVAASKEYKAAVAALDADYDRYVGEIVKLTEIPAPPFKETEKGKAYMAMLKDAGLTDVEMDGIGNVMGIRKGTGGGKLIAIAAHQDTVFPEGTNVKVKRTGSILAAPGVGDDTRGLATLLAYIRAMDKAGIKTKNDILFVGNVGEEGEGDLRGTRYLFSDKGKYHDKISAFMTMDGGGVFVINGATGSKRYRVTFTGPGGHSYGNFGIVNPMAALAQTITQFEAIPVPSTPKTTHVASVVGGGTSVNAIPYSVFLEVDMRSEAPAELAKEEKAFLAIIPAAVAAENKARSTSLGPVKAEIKLIGDRPAGVTKLTDPLVTGSFAAIKAAGVTPAAYGPAGSDLFGSTDANIPISLGIPAIAIGTGGVWARAHSLDEYTDVDKAKSLPEMTANLLILLTAADN